MTADLRVGTYSKRFSSVDAFGRLAWTWKVAAYIIADDIDKWVKANKDTILDKRPK